MQMSHKCLHDKQSNKWKLILTILNVYETKSKSHLVIMQITLESTSSVLN